MMELLAPAGNLEKLKTAIEFGADVVYFGLPDFSLRARVNQFNKEEMVEAAEYCRKAGKKFYITLNIYAHNRHLKPLEKYLKFLKEIQPDGLIVSDPGVIETAKQVIPMVPLHLSTQANATNSEAVKFWQKQGIQRVILARELALDEISQIKKDVPGVELECFVHGAMCLAYSGRCVLSSWMVGRSANLGDCAQPCRWRYQPAGAASGVDRSKLSWKVEMTDEFGKHPLSVEEDQNGSYLLNSHDLSLVDKIKELQFAGIDSVKIEGRSKSVYYVANVTKAYRQVIDSLAGGADGQYQAIVKKAKAELDKLTNRGYSHGFLLGSEPGQAYQADSKKGEWIFCGIGSVGQDSTKREVQIHNYIYVGDQVEIITPKDSFFAYIKAIYRLDGESLASAHGGGQDKYQVSFDRNIPESVFLLRKFQEKGLP